VKPPLARFSCTISLQAAFRLPQALILQTLSQNYLNFHKKNKSCRHERNRERDVSNIWGDVVGESALTRITPWNPMLWRWYNGTRIGYVNRAMERETFSRWLTGGGLRTSIARINGNANRPLIYVRAKGYPR